MATKQLILQQAEPGDDPLEDQFFPMLSKAVQPDSKDIELIVSQLVSLIPQGKPYSDEMSGLVGSCFEIAEQIPYAHPSMMKLVTLIDLCLKSSHFNRVDGQAVSSWETYRKQKLCEMGRDWWNVSGNLDHDRYINFQAFVARLYQRGLFGGHVLPIYTIDDAFGDNPGVQQSQDAYARAAMNYLMITGDGLYEEITDGELELKKWQRWLQQATSISKQDKSSVYAQETIDLANQVVVAMEAIQQLKT